MDRAAAEEMDSGPAAIQQLGATLGNTVIGRVVEGMDVIDRIATVATGNRAPLGEDVPLEPVVVQKASIVAAAP